MTTTSMTPQQKAIADAAQALLDALANVPITTIDWRVEEARKAARTLLDAGGAMFAGLRYQAIATEDSK